MQKFLIIYSVLITVLFLRLAFEQPKLVTFSDNNSPEVQTKVVTKEVLKKEIVYRDSSTKLGSKNQEQANQDTETQAELELVEPVMPTEEEQKKEEHWRDDNSEKMLAFFEQAVGLGLTPEQEQKALSAFRAYDEADPTARADADAAFLNRKLKLSNQQENELRKSITEFHYEPDGLDNELPDSDVQQIDSQNEAFFNHVSPLLDENQRKQLQELMQQGTTFVDE